MARETKKRLNQIVRYFILLAVGFVMVYPLLWMVFATFKANSEIFSTISLLPEKWDFSAYAQLGETIAGQISLGKAMVNTYTIVLPKVVFTVVSSTITAYAFGRFEFAGKKAMFAVMMSTLFLPQVVLNAPQYVMFNQWGWMDSYLPLIVPSLFAVDTYFVFMLIQFLRGIPKELDEAAEIDGCNAVLRLWHVIVPMLKPAIVSCALFQFMWSSNDFMGPLIYVNKVSRYPASIFVKMSMDADAGVAWNKILAVSLVVILPSLIVFFLSQDTFVEGISAGGVKG
ncbi:MAG TPA: carbohydrate ABC transporter permease [Candidatus Hungatella pullicola]|nr:carbohydrate ABC transporter permease [Candidatus Hungatella pullicola]